MKGITKTWTDAPVGAASLAPSIITARSLVEAWYIRRYIAGGNLGPSKQNNRSRKLLICLHTSRCPS